MGNCNTMSINKLNIEKLKIMLEEHIVYEVENYLFATNFLIISNKIVLNKETLPIPIKDEKIINNIFLEFWVLSNRKFYDFLYKKKADNDWLLARHYFKEPTDWEHIIGEQENILKEYIKRSHSMTAHISYTRINDKEKHQGWELNLAVLIIEKLNIFFDSLYDKNNKVKVGFNVNLRVVKNNSGFYVFDVPRVN